MVQGNITISTSAIPPFEIIPHDKRGRHSHDLCGFRHVSWYTVLSECGMSIKVVTILGTDTHTNTRKSQSEGVDAIPTHTAKYNNHRTTVELQGFHPQIGFVVDAVPVR